MVKHRNNTTAGGFRYVRRPAKNGVDKRRFIQAVKKFFFDERAVARAAIFERLHLQRQQAFKVDVFLFGTFKQGKNQARKQIGGIVRPVRVVCVIIPHHATRHIVDKFNRFIPPAFTVLAVGNQKGVPAVAP
jgi:hypothetical protein